MLADGMHSGLPIAIAARALRRTVAAVAAAGVAAILVAGGFAALGAATLAVGSLGGRKLRSRGKRTKVGSATIERGPLCWIGLATEDGVETDGFAIVWAVLCNSGGRSSEFG